MRLRTRISVTIAAVAVAGVAITGLSTYLQVTRAIHDEAEQRLFEAALSLETELRALSVSAQASLSEVSHSNDFRHRLDALARGDLNPGDIRNLAASLQRRTELDFLEILDEKGRVLSNGHWPIYYGRQDSAAWEIVTQKSTFPAAHTRIVQGETMTAVESFIRYETYGRSFYLVGGHALTEKRVQEMGRRTGGALYVQIADGSRILPPDVVVQNVSGLADARIEELEGTRLFVGRPASGEPVGVSLLTIRKPDGSAYGDFVLRISQARLLALVKDLSGMFLLMGGAGVVLAGVIGFWFARRITKPIEELAVAAGRVGAGRSPGSMPVASEDEVGDLVRSFVQMTADLAESRRQLVSAERIAAWREIARRMAHEIKNSLSPIQICVETIRRSHETGREDFDEILAEAVQTVTDEVNGLKGLVNDFSQFARMPELVLKPDSPAVIVERAAALHENNSRGIRVERTIREPLPSVALDADALARAIGNIVLNAVEASPPGSTVRIGAEPAADGFVEICIEDTGPGIPPGDRDRIFEPYYTTKEGGSGLGLAIAYKIVAEHGGRIEMTENPVGGSRLHVFLPAAHSTDRDSGSNR